MVVDKNVKTLKTVFSMKNKTAPNHYISAGCFIGDNTVNVSPEFF